MRRLPLPALACLALVTACSSSSAPLAGVDHCTGAVSCDAGGPPVEAQACGGDAGASLVASFAQDFPQVSELALDGADLYALLQTHPSGDGGPTSVLQVLRFALPCGAPSVLGSEPSAVIGGLAVARGRVYWGTDHGILSASTGGGERQTFATATLAWPLRIVASGDHLFWIDGSGTLSTAPLAGGAPKTLATGFRFVGGLAVDAANAYVTDAAWPNLGASTTPSGQVTAVSIGGDGKTVLASGRQNPGSILVDGGTLFWIDAGTSGTDVPNADGAIVSMPVAGGAPTILASGEAGPADLRKVGAILYWADVGGADGSNSLRKLAPGVAPTDLVPPWRGDGLDGFAVNADRAYWAELTASDEQVLSTTP